MTLCNEMTLIYVRNYSPVLLLLCFLPAGYSGTQYSLVVEEHKPMALACQMDSHSLVWSVVYRNETRKVAMCVPYWNLVGCDLTSVTYKDLYMVHAYFRWSVLTVYSVGRGLTQVICQHGSVSNITNVTVVVKPRELQCDEPVRASFEFLFNITCRFLVLPIGRCTLISTPPVVLHTVHTWYTHRLSLAHDLYTTACTVQAAVDISTYRNVSMFQVMAEPDVDHSLNLSVSSRWLSLESADKVMNFTANSKSSEIQVDKGSEVQFLCFISNAPGTVLRLLKWSTVIALQATPARSDSDSKLLFVVKSTDCDDTATYTCRADHGVTLERSLNVTVMKCPPNDDDSSSLPYIVIAYTALPILSFIIIVHIIICLRYVRRKKQRSRHNTDLSQATRDSSPGVETAPPADSSPRLVGRSRPAAAHLPNHGAPVSSSHDDDMRQEGNGENVDGEISIISPPPNYRTLFRDDVAGPVFAATSTGGGSSGGDGSRRSTLPPSYSSVMLNNLINCSHTGARTPPKHLASHTGAGVISTRL